MKGKKNIAKAKMFKSTQESQNGLSCLRQFPHASKFRCDCLELQHLNTWADPCCNSSKEWLELTFKYLTNKFDYEKDCKELFQGLTNMITDEFKESIEYQKIKQDCNRTVPDLEEFKEGGEGFDKILSVLATITLYDQGLGYTQGMNFIAAALIWHCSADIAFWLYTSLLENYELRKNYIDGFSGFYQRKQKLEEMLQEELPDLADFLEN